MIDKTAEEQVRIIGEMLDECLEALSLDSEEAREEAARVFIDALFQRYSEDERDDFDNQ